MIKNFRVWRNLETDDYMVLVINLMQLYELQEEALKHGYVIYHIKRYEGDKDALILFLHNVNRGEQNYDN